MKSALTRLLACAFLVATATAAFPQFLAPDELLAPAEVDRLNPEARELYNLGASRLDRVNYAGALEAWERASQGQPGHIELAFLVADMSKRLGRRSYGEEAERLYKQGVTAIDRVLRRPDLDLNTLRRAEQAKKVLEHELDGRPVRDQRRYEVGVQVNLEVAAQLNLPAEVIAGSPKRAAPADPRQPFNVRSFSAEGPAGVGLGPTPTPPAAAAGGNPFGIPAGGAGNPFGIPAAGAAPIPASGAGNPFGIPAAGAAPVPASGAGNPFGIPAAGPAPTGSPFGAAASENPFGSAGTGNPFGTAPATGNAGASPFN
jgi:hypothetical protein